MNQKPESIIYQQTVLRATRGQITSFYFLVSVVLVDKKIYSHAFSVIVMKTNF